MKGSCVVCGSFLRPGQTIRIIEFKEEHLDQAIEDLTKIDPEIAADVSIYDGILTMCEDCEHPVEDLLPGPRLNIQMQ